MNLLLEIGTEELPAHQLSTLSRALGDQLQNQFKKAELSFDAMNLFATPRRLAVLVSAVASHQKDQFIERKGPAVSAAFDTHGQPSAAALGFARSCGVALENLERRATEKGEFLYFSYQQKGIATTKLVPELIRAAIAAMPIAKPMRWGDKSIEFIRPVHWVTLLYGDELIKTEILGRSTQNHTFGHRFLHPQAIPLKTPADYEVTLTHLGKVIPNFAERKQTIKQQLTNLENKIAGHIVLDDALLDEVTGLVEWPVALLANFESRFLEVPKEALISAMKTHQKCFPVINQQQQLLPHFVTVSNIESKNPQRVIAGNERVMRARLSDAAFFYHEDLKSSLENRLELLKNLVFQAKLGSMFEKAQRIATLAGFIAHALNLNQEHAKRAGLLAKTDLLSAMVGEFPELQGIMGYYYALQDQELETIAVAIKEHYLPRFAGDDLPVSDLGKSVAIADRLDTLIGIFGIQQAPTGEKDPYGLRRAALSVLRILIEKQLDLDLKVLLAQAQQLYPITFANTAVINELFNFMQERLRTWYLEQGINIDVFNAVMAKNITRPLDFHRRLLAVQHFCTLPEAQALIAANKRVSNILKKENISSHDKIDPSLFESEVEHSLNDLLLQKMKETTQFCQKEQYSEALINLASLQPAIDSFFDKVLVMVENEKIKHNRLALLITLRNLFLQIADVSLLQVS